MSETNNYIENKFQAIIVCKDYSDFLRETLPNTKQIFDKVIVVTDNSDTETVRVCIDNDVLCILSDKLEETKTISGGINEALKYVSKNDWVVNLDADIWLPLHTKKILKSLALDKKCIYGIDRLMCNSYEDWEKFNNQELLLNQFLLGDRNIMNNEYHPTGYFQLWNPIGSDIHSYSTPQNLNTENINYDHADTLHARKFDKSNRKLIPEILCLHLASEPNVGKNWKGRKTKRFAMEAII